MSKKMTDLIAEVEATHTPLDSALVFCEGLVEQLRDVSDNPAEVYALANEVSTRRLEIAEALVKNEEPVVTPVERAKAAKAEKAPKAEKEAEKAK